MQHYVLPLHENRSLTEQCALVLNEEWSRSLTARLHSLDKSSDALPYSLAFVEQDECGQRSVVGHSRLTAVHGCPTACFIESVVVKKCRRGEGLGRRLMEMTEQHAVKLGYSLIYLTTHDKFDFYHHLGYDKCEPVLALGNASSLLANNATNLFSSFSHQPEKNNSVLKLNHHQPSHVNAPVESGSAQDDTVLSGNVSGHHNPPPPPPPLPPPPAPPIHNPPPSTQPINPQSTIHWMKKHL